MANRQGHLKNGNPPGDPSQSPRCRAKRRNGQACQAPAMWSRRTGRYTRCRLHGGASTGPTTVEGLERCSRSNWKHGRRSRAAIEKQRALRDQGRELTAEAKKLQVSAGSLQNLTPRERQVRLLMLILLEERLDSLVDECGAARQYRLFARFDRLDTNLMMSVGRLAGRLN